MAGNTLFRVLRSLWQALAPLHDHAAVMGGIAVSAWKHVRATQDVDLLVTVGGREAEDLLRLLRGAGFRPRREPPFTRLGDLLLLQLLFEAPGTHVDVQVDVMVAESPFHQQALTRRVPVRFEDEDVEVFVLACEDLILLKLAAGRILDMADAAALLRANRGSLDFGHLRHWASQLGVGAPLDAVWSEAHPGETMPE